MKSKEIKRREGEDRNAVWQSLSREEKVRSLDLRLGKGVGATRQRKLLGEVKE